MQDECYCAHDPEWSSFFIEENEGDEDSDCDRGEYVMGERLVAHEDGFGFKVGEVVDS